MKKILLLLYSKLIGNKKITAKIRIKELLEERPKTHIVRVTNIDYVISLLKLVEEETIHYSPVMAIHQRNNYYSKTISVLLDSLQTISVAIEKPNAEIPSIGISRELTSISLDDYLTAKEGFYEVPPTVAIKRIKVFVFNIKENISKANEPHKEYISRYLHKPLLDVVSFIDSIYDIQ